MIQHPKVSTPSNMAAIRLELSWMILAAGYSTYETWPGILGLAPNQVATWFLITLGVHVHLMLRLIDRSNSLPASRQLLVIATGACLFSFNTSLKLAEQADDSSVVLSAVIAGALACTFGLLLWFRSGSLGLLKSAQRRIGAVLLGALISGAFGFAATGLIKLIDPLARHVVFFPATSAPMSAAIALALFISISQSNKFVKLLFWIVSSSAAAGMAAEFASHHLAVRALEVNPLAPGMRAAGLAILMMFFISVPLSRMITNRVTDLPQLCSIGFAGGIAFSGCVSIVKMTTAGLSSAILPQLVIESSAGVCTAIGVYFGWRQLR